MLPYNESSKSLFYLDIFIAHLTDHLQVDRLKEAMSQIYPQLEVPFSLSSSVNDLLNMPLGQYPREG